MIVEKTSKEEVFRLFEIKINQQRLHSDELKYFDIREIYHEEIWVCLSDNRNEILGIAGFEKSPAADEENVFWLNYVTVVPAFRGAGIAKALIIEVVNEISKRKESPTIKLSYTQTGEVLRNLVEETAIKYGVALLHKKLSEQNYIKT